MVSPVFKRRFAILMISLAAAAAFMPATAHAQQVTAVGDGGHLWILQPSPAGGGFIALYRKFSDDPATDLFPVGASTIQGNLLAQGVAVGGGRLWLVYSTGRVQAIKAYDDELGRRGYSSTMHKSLPTGVALKSLAANLNGPWTLVGVETAKALQHIDHPEAKQPTSGNAKDPAAAKDGATKSDTTKSDTTKSDATKDDAKPNAAKDDNKQTTTPVNDGDSKAKESTAVHRLLVMHKNAWHSVPLPEDWPGADASWLVMKSDSADRPWLVTVPNQKQSRVRWYEWVPAAQPDEKATASLLPTPTGNKTVEITKAIDTKNADTKDADAKDGNTKDSSAKTTQAKPSRIKSSGTPSPAEAIGTWRRYETDVNNIVSVQPHASQKQLVLVHRAQTPGKLDLHFQLLRPDRVTDLGTISYPTSPIGWSVAPVGPWLAAIIKQADGEFVWQRINTAGDIDAEPTPLTLHKPSHEALENMYLFFAVMIIATPITILLWRRNPQPQELTLPEGAALSDMVSRMIAALIDMVPCVGIAVVISGYTPMDIVQKHWPGQGQGLNAMWPGAIAVGSFVVYTTLAEMFTGKTMGKHFLRLRVVTMKGEAPDIWQILGRCLFKVFDLIVPLLILLAVFSPYRQRMGDLVARTVVVVEKRPGSDEPSA